MGFFWCVDKKDLQFSAVYRAVSVPAEVGVFQGVLVCDMDAAFGDEDCKLMCGVGVGAEERSEWECQDGGLDVAIRGRAFINSLEWRRSYCLINSGTCTWSAGSQMLSLSGYPFHFRRYCNCFFRP